MRLLPLGLLAFLLACGPAPSPTPRPTWSLVNAGLKTEAVVLALAVDPADPLTAYAATYDEIGLYKTSDGGAHWQPLAVPFAPVFALLFDQRTLYAGASDGVYARRDGDAAWARLGDDLPRARVNALALASDGVLYAAVDEAGVYRWQSNTWTRVSAGLDVTLLSLAAHPTQARTLYAGSAGRGAYRTRDGGQTWEPFGYFPKEFVYAVKVVGENVFIGARPAAFVVAVEGPRWHEINRPPLQAVSAFAADPRGVVYAGKQDVDIGSGIYGVFASTDGGETWEARQQGLPRGIAIFALAIAPSDPQTLYAGARQGVFVSRDAGRTWREANQGLGRPNIFSLAMDPANPQHLYAAGIAGIYESDNAGDYWVLREHGLNDRGAMSLAFAPNDPKTMFAGTTSDGVYWSRDAGRTWEIRNGGINGLAIPVVQVDPTNPQNLYARVVFDRVFKSTNGGVSWFDVWNGMKLSDEVISLVLDPRRPQTLFAGTRDNLYRTDDGAATWRPLPGAPRGQTVLALLLDPAEANHLYAGTTHGVYESRDRGETWTRLGLNDLTVSALALPRPARTLYAGTKYRGLYRSRDAGQTWEQIGPREDISIEYLLVTPRGVYLVTRHGIYRGVEVTAQPGAPFTAENAEFAEVSIDFSAFSATSAVR